MKLSDHDLRQIDEERINKLSETAVKIYRLPYSTILKKQGTAESKFQKQFYTTE